MCGSEAAEKEFVRIGRIRALIGAWWGVAGVGSEGCSALQ